MKAGVYTRRKRVTFVAGQETATPDVGFVACGDGTGFPILVTGATVRDRLDKIGEIWHRVKDAWFTGGGFTWTIFGSPASFSSPASGPPTNRAVDLVDTTAPNLQQRGYCIAGSDDYNDPTYDAGAGFMYSDIGDNERGIHQPVWNTDRTCVGITHPSTNAFSYGANCVTVPDSTWWGVDGGSGSVMSRFTGEIAVVKNDPGDGFFADTNKFYIGFEFAWNNLDPTIDFGGTTNLYSSIFYGSSFIDSGLYVEVCNYVIRLSTGDLTCPIYNGTAGGADFAGTDIIHSGAEWFPYARNSPPTSVWDATNGTKIPEGAVGLDLNDLDAAAQFIIFF